MSQSQSPSPLARFAVRDERARTTLQMLSQTGMMAVAWVVGWKLVAPNLSGVRVLSPVELVHTISATLLPAILSGASAPPSFSAVELMVGTAIWSLPVFTGLFGVMTLSTALWYVVGRLIEPIATTDAGGEA